MEQLFTYLTIISSIAIGWSIGANDAANSVGTAVGSRTLKLYQAIILVSVIGFLGALLQGKYVCKTIGKGIVNLQALDKNVAMLIAVSASFAACIWVALATFLKIPISTSHSIVGGVGGGGLALGVPVSWGVLGNIFICWIVTPIGSAILGYIIYWILDKTLHYIIPQKYIDKIMNILVVLSGCYMAFTWGANDVANATGICSGVGIISPQLSVIIGGLAIVLGVVTMGSRVIETIGTGMTSLLPMMAFSAQLASSLNVQIYTLLGIPVSTSHSIVGAVFGVGLVKGLKMINLKIIREIIICWLATPFISGLICFLLIKIIPRF